MIRYALACDQGHSFESWFPSASAYDDQRRRKLVSCPICGSAKIDKQIMAPSVAKRETQPPATPAPATPAPTPAAEDAPRQVALMSAEERDMLRKLKELRTELTRNSDYVGRKFPEEARRMHQGEIDHRSIWGEASTEEARALLDEGVELHPLPPSFDDHN